MITKRDQDVFNFIEKFKAATTGQINQLFFSETSDRYCRKRLQYLYEQGYLKRIRSTISNDYAYYIKKKSYLQQIHHDLLRTQVYVTLKGLYKIIDWNNEMSIESIRPEAVAYIEDHKIIYPVFVEVHLSNSFNFNKYKDLLNSVDLKALFGLMPRVIICTDRKVLVPNIGLKFKVIGFDMTGLETLFK